MVLGRLATSISFFLPALREECGACPACPSALRGRRPYGSINNDLAAGAATGPEEARARHRPRYLCRLPRLRHRLQGVEYRWFRGAAARFQPLWRGAVGGVVQPRPLLRGRRRGGGANRLLPEILPAL